MPQITILPTTLRNKIAAGEVIERPASVVKELIENSIDAGATDIKVEILRGGKGLIRVTDNGAGMDREDALLCLERHATSKLRGEEDLFNIQTMGFRGEALPSIGSVSRMTLITGQKGTPSGISIEIQGGEIREERVSPAVGTSMEVRDLFFNTPARKKFLKSDSTELFHIIDSITKEALSHPGISFRLFTDKSETMNLPLASGTRERIMQVYGLEFLDGLTEVRAETRGLIMTAFVTKGMGFRNSRSHQFIFINKRPVKDQTISHAVYKAFEGILPQDKHPVFFVFLDIDPRRVDFNVHPAKREVRFESKDDIHRFVNGNIREAIRRERADSIAPFRETPDQTGLGGPGGAEGNETSTVRSSRYSVSLPAGKGVSETVEFPYEPSLPFIYLGDTFIATAGRGGLTLIDHHAAHERILYEKLLNGLTLSSHHLLFPRQVKLSPREYAVVLENRKALDDMGIEVDDFGHDTVMVRSLPEELEEADLRGILLDVAATLVEGTQQNQSLKEGLAARIACHGSVRGRAVLLHEEFQRLLSDLDKTEHPDQCPHGRPTRIFLSLDDLKKMFKRK
jgi:DNA mismatch repair protein MutL